MFYSLASILFTETSKHSHLNLLNICNNNARDKEFCLFFALGNKMDMASLTFLLVNNI